MQQRRREQETEEKGMENEIRNRNEGRNRSDNSNRSDSSNRSDDSGMAMYWYWICNLPKITNSKIKRLLDCFGSPDEVFREDLKDLGKMGILKEEDIRRIEDSRRGWDLAQEYGEFCKLGMEFVHIGDDRYPERLRSLADRPYCLYVKGRLPEDIKPAVSIVGARACSEYGRRMAEEYGRELAASGVQIISGLARGIDGASHKGALLAGGSTFAVLGCGTDICYPEEHKRLYEDIPERGGIISEYPPGTMPLPYLFPARNRIISGLADIVLVIEAREKSGSLITADQALEQGHDVFALPGRVTDKLSCGCNRLIKQGAGIATSPADILAEFSLECKKNNENYIKTTNSLAKEENLVYSCLGLQPKNLDEILTEVKADIQQVLHVLLNLELKGYIEEISKNYYIIKR
ncbi:DNA-processing protein DprA [Anaerobium acetethylicum]|nr:DNA-processing protein DprA [Anaerobium acetethylicum]